LRLAGRFVAAIALFAFTFSPFALLWSRASLIDFLAVALSLWYLEASLAALTGRSRQRWWLATLAAVLGGLALMVKITIGVFWLLPVAVVLSTYWRGWKNRRVALLMSALLLVLPMAGGALWFEISREVRQQNLYAYALNDQTGLAWYFGDLAERLNISDWVNILGRVLAEIGGLLLPIVLILGWRERRELPERWQRATWTGLAILAIAAPLILFNVYAIHDYYLAAIAPVIALYFGLGARYLYRHRERMWTRMLAGGLASAWMFVMLASFNFGLAAVDLSLIMSLSLVMLVLWAGLRQRGAQLRIALLSSALLLYFLAFGTVIAMDLLGGSNYLRQVYFPPPDAHAQASAQIEALVPVDHWAALIVPDRDYNMQWDPSYFYYAHREGLMIGSVVRSLGGLRVACADPRYVLLTLSADQQVSRASCPDGAPIP
jgi:4-amino-4-deoxy-L-arabinose transferase-like glycosyltransferase